TAEQVMPDTGRIHQTSTQAASGQQQQRSRSSSRATEADQQQAVASRKTGLHLQQAATRRPDSRQPTAQRRERRYQNGHSHLDRQQANTSHRVTAQLGAKIDPRVLGGSEMDSASAHYAGQMRRSMQRLVSSTTQFDRMTNGSLALLSDIARMYVLRIGEACKARADLAGRTQPNLLDMADATAQDLGVDWIQVQEWAETWKDNVGTAIETRPETRQIRGDRSQGQRNSLRLGDEAFQREVQSRRGSWDFVSGSEGNDTCTANSRRVSTGDIVGSLHHNTDGDPAVNGLQDDDIDMLLEGFSLECLLLDGGPNQDFDGIIPEHLPALVPISEEDAEEEVADDGVAAAPSLRGDLDELPVESDATAVEALLESAGAEKNRAGSWEGERANGATDHSDGGDSDGDEPEDIASSLLHLTTSSLSVLQSSISNDKALYGFFKPATKVDPSSAPEELLLDFDIPEDELQFEAKADEGTVSGGTNGKPLFIHGNATTHDLLGASEKKWNQARYKLFPDIYNEAAARVMDEMADAPLPMRRRKESGVDGQPAGPQAANGSKQEALTVDHDHDTGSVLDMEIDMDMEIDILEGTPDLKGTSQNSMSFDGMDLGNEQTIDMPGVLESAKDDENGPGAALEPIDVPLTSGLRGSGAKHWASEWFTAAMASRLSKMTASDVVPYDSLFISDPLASRRRVVDELARAFVDSEGGGHLHETTPLDGFGTNANGQIMPNSSGSVLRWTLHHLMQSKGTSSVDSLYKGRSSLAGGVSGDGVRQYITRLSSLIKASAEEEAELAVNGVLEAAATAAAAAAATGPGGSGPEHVAKMTRTQANLAEQLVGGAEKRIPWTQHRLDIHKIESLVAGREPRPAPRPHLSMAPLPVHSEARLPQHALPSYGEAPLSPRLQADSGRDHDPQEGAVAATDPPMANQPEVKVEDGDYHQAVAHETTTSGGEVVEHRPFDGM
ncbi:hypothetical protein EC988_003991, partial [Linderina pennispora]